MVTSEKTIQLVGEVLSVALIECRRATTLYAAGAHGVHKVAHIEALLDVLLGVELTARIEGVATLGDYLIGQRDVGRDYQVTRLDLLHNIVVGHIES